MCPLFVLLQVAAAFVSLGHGVCLPDAIPTEQRTWIQDNDGNDMPIGLLEVAWDSSYLLTGITEVLIEEVLGYHAAPYPTVANGARQSIYAVAGCLDFNGVAPQCDQNETRVHICVDSWQFSYNSVLESINDAYPHLTPRDLGSMGFDGIESMYVTKPVLEAALDAEGLALDYFRSYNLTHHGPKQYFDGIANISTSSLQLCTATDFTNEKMMGDYARFTGDVAGVALQPSGGYHAVCPDGYWWLSPACRSDSSGCIPAITAGTGWKAQAMMQWSTAYGMPTAIGVASAWSTYVSLGKGTRSLFYWWIPDGTFAAYSPSKIIFPDYSEQEWAKGDQKTASAGVYINKAASSNFGIKAPKVRDFMSSMKFELTEVQKLLEDVTAGQSMADAGCQWVLNNRQRWERWVPVDTNCFAGFGMVDASGSYVQVRENATTCAVCPPGSNSEEFLDDTGATHRCVLCPLGTSQGKSAATQCEPCATGTYTNVRGKETCDVCTVGSYQNAEGQTDCIKCSDSRTTQLLAASKVEDCVCEAGFIEQDGACSECLVGLTCPTGSTVELLLSNQSGTTSVPRVLPSYYSNPLVPLATYQCRANCPGGLPGTCDAGLVGLTCGECPEGFYFTSGKCTDCGVAVPAGWVLALALILLAIFMSYYLMTSPYTGKATVLTCTTASMGMMVSMFQNLGVLQTVSVPWPAELSDFLSFFQLFTLNLDSFGFSCLAGGPVQRYVSNCAFFVFVILALISMYFLTKLLAKLLPWPRVKALAWHPYKSMSTVGQFCQVSFTTMSNVGLMPFMCYSHPMGASSVLKYSEVFCGSEEHGAMQFFGILLLCLSLLFAACCFFAAWKAPAWSGLPIQAGIRFLVFRFRPTVWWFGLTLLVRGPFLSLPAVIFPNMPAVQLSCMVAILLLSTLAQTWFLPWKAPILNLLDGITNGLLVMLLVIGIAHQETPSADAMGVLGTAATMMSTLIMCVLGFMILLAGTALFFRKQLGGSQELKIMNLGNVTPTADVMSCLEEVATAAAALKEGSQEQVRNKLVDLGVYDFRILCSALFVLNAELGLMNTSSGLTRSGSFSHLAKGRVTTVSRTSFDKGVQAPKQPVAESEEQSEPPMGSGQHEQSGNRPSVVETASV